MNSMTFYREKFEDYLNKNIATRVPQNLYDPMVYILGIGGKRLRPISVLMTTELFDTSYEKAMNAALAIEIFHNFSLVHDDIMDDASVRRGHPSIHEKWDINTAILSGDTMLIYAYQLFENYDLPIFAALARLFTKTAILVCEGQQYDVDFEKRDDVKIEEYLKMIEYKTAVLVGAAMEMGAIVAEANKEDREYIYKYGCLLGLAFQLMDDYLDTYGDFDSFGKQIGGDIVENKKTFLFLTALKNATPQQADELLGLYRDTAVDEQEKIDRVTQLFTACGVEEETLQMIKTYTQKAYDILDGMHLDVSKKAVLHKFGDKLMNRNN